jgi:5,10-methylenetetrahydromethanopterin reductase
MSGCPRIALRVHGGLPARECAAQARAAEEAGFSTVWFAENPFARGAMSGLAASALATSTIRLGVGVFNPFNRHPTLIAMEVAALDELSEGRVVLGIGAGIRLGQMGIAAPRRIAAVQDAIHLASRLLRGETVEYEGPVFSARGVRLECPLRRAAVPICMAAMGDQALDLCGRIADGLLISNLSPTAFTRRAVAVVARGAVAAGKPMLAEVVQYVTGAIDDDRQEARRRAKATVGAMLVAYCHDGRASAATRSAVRDYSGFAPEEFERIVHRLAQGDTAADVIDDALLDRYALAGTVTECLDRCDAYGDAGATELGLWFAGDQPLHDIARFGRALDSARHCSPRRR